MTAGRARQKTRASSRRRHSRGTRTHALGRPRSVRCQKCDACVPVVSSIPRRSNCCRSPRRWPSARCPPGRIVRTGTGTSARAGSSLHQEVITSDSEFGLAGRRDRTVAVGWPIAVYPQYVLGSRCTIAVGMTCAHRPSTCQTRAAYHRAAAPSVSNSTRRRPAGSMMQSVLCLVPALSWRARSATDEASSSVPSTSNALPSGTRRFGGASPRIRRSCLPTPWRPVFGR